MTTISNESYRQTVFRTKDYNLPISTNFLLISTRRLTMACFLSQPKPVAKRLLLYHINNNYKLLLLLLHRHITIITKLPGNVFSFFTIYLIDFAFVRYTNIISR